MAGAAVATFLTNPIDVVKTRVQSKSLGNVSTLKEIVKIARTEGVKGLYLGIPLRMLKTSLHLSIYLTLYEEVLNFIKNKT